MIEKGATMDIIKAVKDEMQAFAALKRPGNLEKFFKATPGGYAEHDKFIGVTVPNQRKIAGKFYKNITLEETAGLLRDPIHEYRLTALFMLVSKYEKAKTANERQAVVDIYLDNIGHVNNWDLVDSSAHKILGPHLMDGDKSLIYDFANSGDLWKQRIAMLTTYHFIRKKRYEDALNISKILLNHSHDLIHKAVGWMLREIGNRDLTAELDFLKKHYRSMPRTMLRYAIEKFDEKLRQQFLKGELH